MSRLSITARACAAAFALLAGIASAQPYPSKPIRMMVPFPPGSASDFLARTIGQKLGDAFNQQVVTDNRPGAGGLVGTQIVARATPDGYTLALIGQPQVTNTVIRKDPGYDPFKDFQPVSHVANMANVLVLSAALPAKNLTELVALAKAKPGQLNFGSAGPGSSSHLAAELFNAAAGVRGQHVPFKIIADIYTEMAAGRVHYYIFPLPAAMPLLGDGKLRAVATGSAKRTVALPDVPTMQEAGMGGFLSESWFGIIAPIAVPRPIVARVHGEVQKILAQADTRERFLKMGAEPGGGPPADFLKLQREEQDRIRKLAQDIGMKPQ